VKAWPGALVGGVTLMAAFLRNARAFTHS
jgi:hypothetical protein